MAAPSPSPSPPFPSVADVSAYIQSLFPSREGDVRFPYHTPRSPSYDARALPATHLVLSITPTPGFYAALSSSSSSSTPRHRRRTAPLAFLHRPWSLDRRSVPRAAAVLSSHKGFDEVLTVGNNAALARRLSLDAAAAPVIRGYKGDPLRTIGLVGRVLDDSGGGGGVTRAEMLRRIRAEFGGAVEGAFGFPGDEDDDNNNNEEEEGEEQAVAAVAIMNAFHPEEVERAVKAAVAGGAIGGPGEAGRLLYLTGAVREPGLAAARGRGLAVACVGHRACEEWGIRYMAECVRGLWPSVEVVEVLEEEEVMEVVGKRKKGKIVREGGEEGGERRRIAEVI